MRRNRVWIAAAGVLTLLATGCGKSGNVFKPSVDQQKKLGDEAAKEYEKKYKFVTGDKLARTERVGERLYQALPEDDRKTWTYKFHVVEDKEVNAFAIPGGNVYMYTGLLDRITTDDELAAVLGHEMTHVRAQHWAKQVASNQERSAGLSVLLGAMKASSDWYSAADVVNTLSDLRYSRKDEDEADAGGLSNMVAAGFDPQGMLDLFKILQDAGGSGGTPAFLRDHPMTSDRVKKTQERIAALKKG
ncbi:MAG TPA: M48 family metallopeptidase [Armatimonadota bacterium]|jgi:predicted Zn-dependent protease